MSKPTSPGPCADQPTIRSRHGVEALAGHLPTPEGVVGDAINAIRFLAVDAVQRADSGHPGTAMALAPLAYALYARHLRHDPQDPGWPDRDRFVLSIGHASLLQYAALHLSGYDLTLDDIAKFRQWGSPAPGHPEPGETPGVEVATGPLGQGVANAVGMAIAERLLARRFNTDEFTIIDHRTWAIAGDGDMMEGVTSEAASLAGHLKVGKLTVFYDDNRISLEGPTRLHFSEDVGNRFTAYGWQVLRLFDAADLDAIAEVVGDAVHDERPTLVIVHTHIGIGSPVVGTAEAHGAPLGEEAVVVAREVLGWPHPPFEIPGAVYEHWRQLVADRAAARQRWDQEYAAFRREEPNKAAELKRVLAGKLPNGWEEHLPRFEPGTRVASRAASGFALNAIAPAIPELVGGAADVGPSTKTLLTEEKDIGPREWAGRNLRFGVREHAMGSILNGLAAHGGVRVFGATFFVFSDYMRPAIRMAALMQLPVVFVFTHDSIGLGEDGPTHQPVEHLASLRAIPGLTVIRPADANETAQAWRIALEHEGPTALVLSRQDLMTLDPSRVEVAAGASVVAPGDDAVIVATGSEVELALVAHERLAAAGIAARVVSMPSWELFRAQSSLRREEVIPRGIPSLAVEAGASQGWCEFVDATIGLDRFGASAPAGVLYERFGFSPDAIAGRVRALLGREEGAGDPSREELR
jgi:transketolase